MNSNKDPTIFPAAMFQVKRGDINYDNNTVEAAKITMLTHEMAAALPAAEVVKLPVCQGKFVPDKQTGKSQIELWELITTVPPRWARNKSCVLPAAGLRSQRNTAQFSALARGDEVTFKLGILHNVDATPVAFDYQRVTFLDASGRSCSTEMVQLERQKNYDGEPLQYSMQHFSVGTYGHRALSEHLAFTNDTQLANDLHVALIPTHLHYTGYRNQWALTAGQITAYLNAFNHNKKWFELSLDEIVQTFWQTRNPTQLQSLKEVGIVNVGQQMELVIYHCTDNYASAIHRLVSQSFNNKCAGGHKLVKGVRMVTHVSANDRFGGMAASSSIGTNKMLNKSLFEVYSHELGYKVPTVVTTDDGANTAVHQQQYINIDLAILKFKDEGKHLPMVEKKLQPMHANEAVPMSISQDCNEYIVYYVDFGAVNTAILQMQAEGTIRGTTITINEQRIFGKFKAFSYSVQGGRSADVVRARFVTLGAHVAPINPQHCRSFTVTSYAEFPLELAQLAKKVKYVKIVDRRTYWIGLFNHQSKDDIPGLLGLMQASESSYLVLKSGKGKPWTSVTYDKVTTLVGGTYTCYDASAMSAQDSTGPPLYIHGFETVMTADGVQAFAQHYLETEIKVIHPREATGQNQIHAKFLHTGRMGPGESKLKILALSTNDENTRQKLEDGAFAVDVASHSRYKVLKSNDDVIPVLVEHSRVFPSNQPTTLPQLYGH